MYDHPQKLEVTETDNRDISTTELVLETGDRVTVNPWELAENAIENGSRPWTVALLRIVRRLAG